MYNIGDMMSHVLSGQLILLSEKNKLISLGGETVDTYHYRFIYLDTLLEDGCYESYLDRNFILEA